MLRSQDPRSCGRRSASASSAGFTLIEIMVVVMILGLLAGLVAFNVTRSAHEARMRAAEVDCRMIAAAVRLHVVERGRFPTIEELTRRKRGRSYLEAVPDDPWGEAYELRIGDEQGEFEVRSAGENRVMDDEDDVTSASALSR